MVEEVKNTPLEREKDLNSNSYKRPPLHLTGESSRAWAVVEKSRHPKRPHCLDYLHKIFSDFELIRGDRRYSEDPAIVAGVGELRNDPAKTLFFVGNQKGRSTKEKVSRNFGMAKPEGYRKAMRVVDLAERFSKPLLTLIDTPGAYPGIGAEERGQAEAIASCIHRVFTAQVPTVGVVLGEGGSGGALALGICDRLVMLENATYSVISPESCAAILWGYAGESRQAAEALKMAAPDVFKLGLCDEVISEGSPGAHENFDSVVELLCKRLDFFYSELEAMPAKERLDKRYQRYRYIDSVHFQVNQSIGNDR